MVIHRPLTAPLFSFACNSWTSRRALREKPLYLRLECGKATRLAGISFRECEDVKSVWNGSRSRPGCNAFGPCSTNSTDGVAPVPTGGLFRRKLGLRPLRSPTTRILRTGMQRSASPRRSPKVSLQFRHRCKSREPQETIRPKPERIRWRPGQKPSQFPKTLQS